MQVVNRVAQQKELLNRLVLLATLSAVSIIVTIPVVSATLWDLIIEAKFVQSHIDTNQSPKIIGTISDHASKPISNATVRISFSDKVGFNITDTNGNFVYQFPEQSVPGTYMTQISARLGDLKGFATTKLEVGNEQEQFESSFESIYENVSKNDPYKTVKEKHNQKIIEKQQNTKLKHQNISAKKLALDEKREDSKQKRVKALKDADLGNGTYSREDQDKYISKLDRRAKETISTQIEYTRQIFEEAKYEMKRILDNGGSLQDAKKAYFEKIASTKEKIETIGDKNNTKNYSEIKKQQESKINSKKVKGLKLNKNLK